MLFSSLANKLAFFLVGIAIIGGIAAIAWNIQNKQPTPSTTEITATTSPISVLKPAELTVVLGQATIIQNGQKSILEAGKTAPLSAGVMITTDSDSIAVLDYHDGTLCRLGPNSEVSYTVEGKVLKIKQILGNAYYRFQNILGLREELQVETNTTLAGVRGTSFAVFASNQTKIVTNEHTVTVSSKDENGMPIPTSQTEVEEGNQAEVATQSSTPTEKVIVMTPQEEAWLNFNTQADNLYDQGDMSPTELITIAQEFVSETKITPTPSATSTPGVTSTPTPIPMVREMFGTGYNSGSVQTSAGIFSVSCIGANKNSTKVVTDSANENDCTNDCPVKPLAEYVAANGGFAGMNGMYFCPPDYPACADKKNSFDTLFFNSRVKRYINSDNNVYSVIPFLVIDGNGNPRFIAHSQEWGRDTGIQAGIAGNPLLIHGGSNVSGNYSLDDKQRNTKSNRGAFVQKADNIYLCVTRSATVPDTAQVFQTLSVDNAINIDGGGSTALWVNGGYKFGPGRALPNAIIFANR